MNNKYKIIVKHPLIRPGLTIKTECSEKYLVAVVNTVMDKVRYINEEYGFAGDGQAKNPLIQPKKCSQ